MNICRAQTSFWFILRSFRPSSNGANVMDVWKPELMCLAVADNHHVSKVRQWCGTHRNSLDMELSCSLPTFSAFVPTWAWNVCCSFLSLLKLTGLWFCTFFSFVFAYNFAVQKKKERKKILSSYMHFLISVKFPIFSLHDIVLFVRYNWIAKYIYAQEIYVIQSFYGVLLFF